MFQPNGKLVSTSTHAYELNVHHPPSPDAAHDAHGNWIENQSAQATSYRVIEYY